MDKITNVNNSVNNYILHLHFSNDYRFLKKDVFFLVSIIKKTII